MAGYPVAFRFDPQLRLFLRRHSSDGSLELPYDGTSSLGHLVESAGVPLPEVGDLLIGEARASPSDRIPPGLPVTVRAVPRPQPLPGDAPRFCLDVHLGALARRLRLVGLDTWYRNDTGDDELIERAAAENRMLLTQDRALLRRRAVRHGAYVRGDRPDRQLLDVLDRFTPPLAPWTRCPACNGPLAPAAKSDLTAQLQPGTQRTYQRFSRCQACGRAYWRGAHARRLEALIRQARGAVAGRLTAGDAERAAGTGQAPTGTPAG